MLQTFTVGSMRQSIFFWRPVFAVTPARTYAPRSTRDRNITQSIQIYFRDILHTS